MQKTDVLIFVEEAGAANYVAGLPAELRERGWTTALLASGLASNWLSRRGVDAGAVDGTAAAGDILEASRPALVIVGTSENPNSLAPGLVAEARSAGVESVGVVDSRVNVAYRFRGDGPLTHAPDWLLVPDEWTKQAFVGLGHPPDRTVVCGHPHHDFVLAKSAELAREGRRSVKRRVLPEVAEDQKVVLFATEGSAKLARRERSAQLAAVESPSAAKYTFEGWGNGSGRTETVLEEFLDAARTVNPRPYLVLAVHPMDRPEDYEPYLGEFDNVSSGGTPLELVYATDLVVGMTSMLLSEAVLLGIPVLSIVPTPDQTEWVPDLVPGMTTTVSTREELREALPRVVRRAATPMRGVTERLPGANSARQAAELIGEILHQRAAATP